MFIQIKKMSENLPSLDNLKEIKEELEDKMSDSSYESSDDSDSKYNNLKTKIRYMQLEMVNKDIELTEFREKLNIFVKSENLNKKINFLFERLDNAYQVLNERINNINDIHFIKFNTINILNSIKESCKKVQNKYSDYIVNELYILIDNKQIYLKNAIESLYDIKMKRLEKMITNIDVKMYNTQFYNIMWGSLILIVIIIWIQIILYIVGSIIGYY